MAVRRSPPTGGNSTMKAAYITPEPSDGPWEPLMLSLTREMVGSLRELGVEVFEVNLKARREAPGEWYEKMSRFAPDFLSAVNWNYLLLAGVFEPRLLHVPFPVVALWDDPLGAMVNHLSYRPEAWEEAETEASPKDSNSRIKAI